MGLGMSLTKMEKRVGEMADPWGTPAFGEKGFDREFFDVNW